MSTSDHHEPTPTRLLPELLGLIAAELYHQTQTRKHFAACALVCKEFQASFRPFVFREINIRAIGILRRLATLLRSSPHIGAYVRVLSILSNRGWEDWEEDFSIISHRLINLQDVKFSISHPKTLVGHTDIFRRAITCILSYPSIRSMFLRGQIVFAISPRLLLASLEDIQVIPCFVPHDHIYDLEYWESLNATYLNLLDSSAAKERLGALTKCRSLNYRRQGVPVWLSYVLAVQPTAFANLTALTLQHVHDQPRVQMVLALAGAGLQILDISLGFQTDGSSTHLPLNLSHNTSLQALTLSYERDHSPVAPNPMPQIGLSVVETSLKSVNAPSLRSLCVVIMALECCGGQSYRQSPHLRRFDSYFSDFSERHPYLRYLKLSIDFEHYPSCKDNVTCNQSPLNNPSEHQTTLKGHFPFLTTEKPTHLEAKLGRCLKYSPLPSESLVSYL